jgi:hypothetical protein
MATEESEDRFFGPARCDEVGNADCPYVVLGRLEEGSDGHKRIRVIEPRECAERWPTLSLLSMVPYEGLPHGEPRRLRAEEVRSLVALLAVSGPRQ